MWGKPLYRFDELPGGSTVVVLRFVFLCVVLLAGTANLSSHREYLLLDPRFAYAPRHLKSFGNWSRQHSCHGYRCYNQDQIVQLLHAGTENNNTICCFSDTEYHHHHRQAYRTVQCTLPLRLQLHFSSSRWASQTDSLHDVLQRRRIGKMNY